MNRKKYYVLNVTVFELTLGLFYFVKFKTAYAKQVVK